MKISVSCGAIALGSVFAVVMAQGCGSDAASPTTDAGTSGGDSSVACPSGATTCGGFCVDATSDPKHCGACDKACATGEVCTQGVCGTTCSGGTTKCGTTCADTKIDPKNCGGCGTTCAAGEICTNGGCAASCGAGTTKCGTACVDTKADPKNCGGCGTTCAAGQLCSNGGCAPTCSAGYVVCGADAGADAGASYCAHTADDRANCGSCGNACPAGQACVNSGCACPTNEPDLCGTGSSAICTSLGTDPANCSACGTSCGAGLGCGAGLCGTPESVFATATSTTSAHVTWTAPPGPGLAVTGYTIVSTPGNITVMSTTTSADVTGLTSGTTYTFKVTPTTSRGAGLYGVSNSIRLCGNVTRMLTGVDHTSLNYGNGGGSWPAPDNLVRAYESPPGYDITTWVEFNTAAAGVPSSASVVSMTLTLNAITVQAAPNVEVQYTSTHGWVRASATVGTMPRGAVVHAASVPTLGLNAYAIDVNAQNWSTDFAAGTITFGVTNTNSVYSYAYYDGTLGGTKPVLSITTCE